MEVLQRRAPVLLLPLAPVLPLQCLPCLIMAIKPLVNRLTKAN